MTPKNERLAVDLKCRSCERKYASPATHYGFPALAAGGNSPDPWPLCEMHAWPYGFIAGWKPVRIEEYEASKS